MDEARIELFEPRPRKAQAIEHAGTITLDQYVRGLDKRGEIFLAAVALEIDLHHSLAAVHELVAGMNAVGIERRQRAHGLAAGGLHLHHLGAEIGQMQRRLRPRNELAQVEDANAGEEISELHGSGLHEKRFDTSTCAPQSPNAM